MKRSTLLLLTMFMTVAMRLFGQSNSEVVLPSFQDTYSDYVKKLESGETNIDYQDFRFSFLKSEQFNLAQAASKEFDSLKREMYVQMNAANHSQIIHITKQLLSIDYTDMKAHKILRQTYKIIGDTANAAKYKTIQFGLMNSILQKGDGRSCETAWPVIQVEEEYFILEMVGAKLKEQTLVEDGGICDKMDFKVDGKNKTYYFEVSKIFEGYKKMGID
jgi:hypothetical protein